MDRYAIVEGILKNCKETEFLFHKFLCVFVCVLVWSVTNLSSPSKWIHVAADALRINIFLYFFFCVCFLFVVIVLQKHNEWVILALVPHIDFIFLYPSAEREGVLCTASRISINASTKCNYGCSFCSVPLSAKPYKLIFIFFLTMNSIICSIILFSESVWRKWARQKKTK